MKELSIKAKIYIISTILLGLALLAWDLPRIEHQDVWVLLILSVVASLSLIFKVIGATERSHYNISFLIYAFTFVMFGPEACIGVILLSNLVEWAWHRYPWYIQCFNIATYVIAIQLSGEVYELILEGNTLQSLSGVAAVMVAMATFTLVNHLLVGIVIWLARGETFSKSGVFEFFPLMLDFTLLCMGALTGLVWLSTPYGIVLALLPLYLIFSTLKVPALERKSETDPKTGLFNAEHFKRVFQAELSRAQRFERPLTIVLADLDLLRNINNTYGHLAGDEVLIGVANILTESVREYDVVSRFGGEEYAIMMPETTPEEAYPRVQAIRLKIERAQFSIPTSVTPIQATMSFGISGREGADQTPSEIIHNADTALYHAKLKGRNGVFLYSGEDFASLFGESVPPQEETKPAETDSEALIGEPISNVQVKVDERSPTREQESGKNKEEVTAGKAHKSRPKWIVNGYIALLGVSGLCLFAFIHEPTISFDPLGLAIFTFLVALTEWLSIDIYVRNSAVSTSAAPMLAGILLYGNTGAIVLAMTFATVALVKHRSHFSRFVFNFSNQLLAGMLITSVVWLFGSTFTGIPTFLQILVSFIAAGLIYLSTTAFIAVGIALDYDLPPKEVWVERFSWLAPYYLGMGLLAYALVYSYQVAAWTGTLIVLVPLLLLRLSQKQYIDRTKTVVNELRENNQILEESSAEISKLNDALLETLSVVIDLRDPFVLGHSRQVTLYSLLIARKLGLSKVQVDRIRKASLLHDIGKLGISDSILLKPGKLTQSEYETIKHHSVLGANILQSSHSLKDLIPIVRHHHERYDGEGYPDGLAGDEIPIEARIVALADAVEAMASDRPYRKGRTRAQVLEEINKHAGTQFDPQVVRVFTEIVENESERDRMIVNLGSKHVFTEQPQEVFHKL